MQSVERKILQSLLAAGCIAFVMALIGPASKWLTTSGLIFDMAGLVQLNISGLFECIIEKYGDETKYPYGPPSHITRRIIDDPDNPLRTRVRNVLYFDSKTGFRLIVAGCVLQLVGAWF